MRDMITIRCGRGVLVESEGALVNSNLLLTGEKPLEYPQIVILFIVSSLESCSKQEFC